MLKRLLCSLLLPLLMQNAYPITTDAKPQPWGLPSLFATEQPSESDNPSASDLDSQLADVEKRYGETLAQLRQINQQIAHKQQALDEIRENSQKAQHKLDKENNLLANQVRMAYQLGQQHSLKLMLNAQSGGHSDLMLGYFQSINNKRLAKLAELKQDINVLDQLDALRQKENESLLQQLQKKRAENIALEDFRKKRDSLLNTADPSQRQNILAINQDKFRQLLASLPKNDGLSQATAGDTPSEQSALSEEYPQVNGPFSALKGYLSLPVQQQMRQKITPVNLSGIPNGVIINAKEGTEVHAVSEGKVVFANWLKGLGLLMIIRHQDKYLSLYAYNQSLYKHKDEHVKAGDVIASVGRSGGRSQPGLYFEIRQDGKALDPLMWCK